MSHSTEKKIIGRGGGLLDEYTAILLVSNDVQVSHVLDHHCESSDNNDDDIRVLA